MWGQPPPAVQAPKGANEASLNTEDGPNRTREEIHVIPTPEKSEEGGTRSSPRGHSTRRAQSITKEM
jgi:hypothetical protein